MYRLAFILVGLLAATLLAGAAALRLVHAATGLPRTPAGAAPDDVALVRCLGDVDDLLDTVRGAASFAEVRPTILRRVHQHAAAGHRTPDPGRLSRAAAEALRAATDRHAAAVRRADRVAPGVAKFFEHDVAAVLNPN